MADDSNKAPSLPWYPRDFAGDEPVQLMTLEEEGAYRRLLDHQWLHGSIPADPKQLAKVCKNVSVAKMGKLWPSISGLFVAMPAQSGRLQNRKLERVRQAQREYQRKQSEAGKLGAKVRWEKPSDGNPIGDQHGEAMADGMADECLAVASASAVARPSTKNGSQPKKKHGATAPVGPPDWVNQAVETYAKLGSVAHGTAGKMLKPIVSRRGWSEVKQALECFCRLAPYQEYLNRVESNTLRPGEEKVKKIGYNTKLSTFVEQYAFWAEQSGVAT